MRKLTERKGTNMLKRIIRWIKSLFVRGGYRCDVCGKWWNRVDGKATVVHKTENAEKWGPFPAIGVEVVELHCPDCAKK
jgi:hypothetical protein